MEKQDNFKKASLLKRKPTNAYVQKLKAQRKLTKTYQKELYIQSQINKIRNSVEDR